MNLDVGTKMEYQTLSKEKNNSIRFLLADDDDRIWIVLALLVGVALRAYFLAQPMRYDESFTFLNFVNRDLKDLFFYPLPNNHVLHSVLTKISTFIWGANPVSIRLTAFIAGVALIPIVYKLCRILGQSGIFASFAIAISPYFILYSTTARGYTLLVLFSLLLTLMGIRITDQPSILRTSIYSLIASLGMLTMPSMLFPIAGIYLWVHLLLLINKRDPKSIFYSFSVPALLITCTLTALFYTPVILASNGIKSIVANRFVKAQPWDEFVSQVYPHFIQTIIDFTRDIPSVLLVATLILFAIGIIGAVKQRNWPIFFILPSLIITSGLIFLIKQKIPFARTWIYMIPFFILVADSGFTYITAMVSDRIRSFIKVTTFIICAFISITLISKNAILNYQDTGVFAEAEFVAKFLEPIMSSNDVIHVRTPADWPLYFYMWYHNVPRHKEIATPESKKEFVVIMKNSHSRVEMTNKQYITLLDIGNVTLFQILDPAAH